jgi:tetratricopeptide (TPR) repeat protein
MSFLAALITAGAIAPLAAESSLRSKDVGPSGACDVHAKESAAWVSCVGAAKAGMPDVELFYAGYWLAKSGRYAEALGYLTLANKGDERVLTYIGFATRKLGDVDGALPFYGAALEKNPNYSVARAYLGEAWLSKGEPAKARDQLAEIERRCGKSCAEYADLAGHVAAYEAGVRG